MAGQAPRTRRDMEADIIARALKDEGFARALRADPKAVIEREVGKLPAGIEVKVVEETPDTLYLVLPAHPSPGRQLSEEDLDRVTGAGICADAMSNLAGLW